MQDDYDIQMTQTMEREVSVMCNLSKGVREIGRAEGHAERALSDLRNLMETLGLTIEQAMAALKVPEGERQKYMDLLERQQLRKRHGLSLSLAFSVSMLAGLFLPVVVLRFNYFKTCWSRCFNIAFSIPDICCSGHKLR